ncbi:TPA: hypothetical protein R0J09_001532 [Klebsiella quasipneumoniae]|uniref:HNH endonuclease n=1 Tax=Klebsiella quasipneumoniae TaxID=1463165 RepID=UPI002929BD35|nr:hypothetical protein [Klebsiella quasipneumoniae]
MKKNQLKAIEFSDDVLLFISKYDGVNYGIWNSTEGSIVKVRGEIRKHYIPLQKNFCSYCRQEYTTTDGLVWTVEHILSKSKYPRFLFEPLNLAMACRDCNRSKDAKENIANDAVEFGDLYPQESSVFNIIHPHFDKYSLHIELRKQGRRYIYNPLDEKGEKTFEVCNLIRFTRYETYAIEIDEIILTIVDTLLDSDDSDSDVKLTEAQRERVLRNLKESDKLSMLLNRDFIR